MKIKPLKVLCFIALIIMSQIGLCADKIIGGSLLPRIVNNACVNSTDIILINCPLSNTQRLDVNFSRLNSELDSIRVIIRKFDSVTGLILRNPDGTIIQSVRTFLPGYPLVGVFAPIPPLSEDSGKYQIQVTKIPTSTLISNCKDSRYYMLEINCAPPIGTALNVPTETQFLGYSQNQIPADFNLVSILSKNLEQLFKNNLFLENDLIQKSFGP